MKGVGTLLHAGSAVLTIPRPNIKDRCREIKFPFPTSLTHCLVCVAVGNENDRETSNRELKNRYSLYPRLHHLFGTFIGEQTNTWAAVTVKKLEPIKINGTNACLTTPYLLWFFREQNLANEALGENFTMRGCQIILVRIRRWIHNPFCIFLYPRNDSPRSNDFNSDLGFRTDSKSLQTMILWSNGRSISISFSHRVELIVNSFLIISRENWKKDLFFSLEKMFG